MSGYPAWFYVAMAVCAAVLLSWRVRYAVTMLVYAGLIVLAVWTVLSLARGDLP
jgi:hypothetical protein